MRNTADVTGGKPIAVSLQSISGVSAINPLVALYDIHGGKKRCYTFILSRTPHEACIIFIRYLELAITARWPRGQSARRAIAESKQRSQRPVIGWVTKIY
jgi:hypothetical protein